MARVVRLLDVNGPFFVKENSTEAQQSTSWVESVLRTLLMLVREPELWDSAGNCAIHSACSSDEMSNVLLALLMPIWQLSDSIVHARVLVLWGGVSAIGRWLSRAAIGPLRPPLSTEVTGTHGFDLRIQLALRTALCGLLCCFSRIQESHAEILRPLTCHGLLTAVGINAEGTFGVAKSKATIAPAGSTEWEAFVLGVLRNVLLANRTKVVCTTLRTFVPWLVECLSTGSAPNTLQAGSTQVTAVSKFGHYHC